MRIFQNIAVVAGLLALFFAAAPVAYAQDAPSASAELEQGAEKFFNAESFMLDNGMEVVVLPNHRVPVVTHMVWYKVGAADEAPGQSGLAHFVEHMMFKGSENVPPGELSLRVKALGGKDNAFTSQNYTAYFQSMAREHLETVMRMEADRMRGLILPPDDVVSERLVVLEERRQRTENDPRGYFSEQMNAALFKNHPYGNPVVGWLHEIDALTRENVAAFHDKYYAPNNAILIVGGDMTAEELKPLAEEIYGTVPARDVPPRRWTEVPPLIANELLVLHHKSIEQPVFRRRYRVPGYRQDKDASLALDVLQNILSGGASTRLYKSLVVEQKIASSVSLYYNGTAWSDGTVGVGILPVEGVSMEAVEKAFEEELRKLIKDGVTEQELAEAKTRLKDEAVYALDSLRGPAMIFGQSLTTGANIDDLEYWPDDIDTVTTAQVRKVAMEYLNPDDIGKRPHVTGYILPEESKDNAITE